MCTGYTHALRIIFETLLRAGASEVAFEDPSIPDYPALAEHMGLRPTAVPIHDDGLRVDALRNDAAAVLTPAHQHPLGVSLSPERRTNLLAWAARTGGLVVEDDYDVEFRYDRQPIGALQGMAPDHVVYVGSVSKTVAPGQRIGWIVSPTDLVPRIRETLKWDNAYVGVLDQLVLARLLTSGEMDRHLRRCRTRYRRRRDHLGQIVAGHAPPGARLTGIAAGLQAVLTLPGTSAAEDAFLEHLESRDLHMDGLSSFYREPKSSRLGVVIGYATPPEHSYGPAMTALGEALRSWSG